MSHPINDNFTTAVDLNPAANIKTHFLLQILTLTIAPTIFNPNPYISSLHWPESHEITKLVTTFQLRISSSLNPSECPPNTRLSIWLLHLLLTLTLTLTSSSLTSYFYLNHNTNSPTPLPSYLLEPSLHPLCERNWRTAIIPPIRQQNIIIVTPTS